MKYDKNVFRCHTYPKDDAQQKKGDVVTGIDCVAILSAPDVVKGSIRLCGNRLCRNSTST